MKKKLNHKKPLVDQEKKYFLPQFIMKKIKKWKKRKKKSKYCSVDPTRLLFSNFTGKLNPKNFSRKSQDGSTGVINVHLTKQLPTGKQKIDAPVGNYLCTIFVSPLPKQARKNHQKAPPAFISTPLSAVCQDLNALLNHINFLCILFSFMYLCYNTLSSKPFV